MILLLCIVLGIAAGYLAKGRISGVLELKLLWLPIAAFALSAVPSYIAGVPLFIRAVLLTGSYGACLAFLVMNREYLLGAVLAMAGTICNYLVIAANGFKMPISEYALSYYPGLTAEAVLEKRSDYFVAVGGEAKMLILGDVICIPIPGIGGFLSVGDVFLALGLMVMIISAMTRADAGEKESFLYTPRR